METQPTLNYIRHVAVKVSIGQIWQGVFIAKQDEPSYLQTTDEQKLFRVNLMASVLGKERIGSVTSLLLDDGSGQISLRFFEENERVNALNIGDLILVVGRVRVYNQEKYLAAELVKTVDPAWLKVRKKELAFSPEAASEEIVQEKVGIEEEIVTEEAGEASLLPTEKIIKTVQKLDQGSGVLIEEIIEKLPLAEVEATVEKMLKEGSIFQIQPGRVKVL